MFISTSYYNSLMKRMHLVMIKMMITGTIYTYKRANILFPTSNSYIGSVTKTAV